MTEFKKILCPTDFSEYSEYAMQYAAAFAQISGASIDCVHVVDMGLGGEGVYASSADVQRSLDAVRAKAEKELEHYVRKEHFLGLEIAPHLRTGHTATEIAAVGDEIGADLIIVATHGRSGLDRLVFGSVCDKLLRHSNVPVLAIKHPEHEALGEDGSLSIDRILCPMDFSEFSHSTLPLAQELAKKFGASITLAHVVDVRFDYPEWTAQAAMNTSESLAKGAQEDLDRIASEMVGIETDTFVATGAPHRELADKIEADNIDLVILPTHGRKGLAHALLGSVTERIVRTSKCPVLTIRPSE